MLNRHALQLALILNETSPFGGPAWTPTSPCPSTIIADIGGGYNGNCAEGFGAWCRFPDTATIHAALVHCPGVRELDLRFEVGGCMGPEVGRWNLPVEEMDREKGEKYAGLKRLSVDGYKFGGLWARQEETLGGLGAVRWGFGDDVGQIVVGGVEGSSASDTDRRTSWIDMINEGVEKEWEREGKGKTNLDLWIEAMDWSQLEELSINTARSEMGEVASKLPQHLVALKTLDVVSFPFIQGLGAHTLERLRWFGPTMDGLLERILELQGKSLKSLEYRCAEAVCPDWPQHFNVSAVSTGAPQLQHVAFNMARGNGTWPLEHLDALAGMSSLQSADLYFRLQSDCEVYGQYLSNSLDGGDAYRRLKAENRETGHCQGKQRYASPYLNASTAQDMFSRLRSNKIGAELKEVTFRAGDWNPPYDGPLPMESFLDDNRILVECKVDAGEEICEMPEPRDMFDWVWDGQTWVFDPNIDDLERAEYADNVELMGQIKEKIRKRLDSYGHNAWR